MYSSLIGKVQKAQHYSHERERLKLLRFSASFRGEHRNYLVAYEEGDWLCSCDHFHEDHFCSHVMAIERILEDMILQRVSYPVS